jgi:hypothetical protein
MQSLDRTIGICAVRQVSEVTDALVFFDAGTPPV